MPQINHEMMKLGYVRSVIRDTFEYGLSRKREIGDENVFDFSLGNPSVPAPHIVDATAAALLKGDTTALHGYTSAPGDLSVRQAVCDDINRRFAAGVRVSDIYMTCGAAASLTVSLTALVCPGDEVMVFAPFFPEYRVFIEHAGARCVTVDADEKNFEINFSDMHKKISEHTKAVIINTPNNPTGKVISEKNLHRLAEELREYSKRYGHDIVLISDEPYRELVYDASTELPYLTNIYDSTIVCYSFSKSLSLPGERIGYIVVSPSMPCGQDVYAAVCGAGRALGFVCAPSLMQKVIKEALGQTSDLETYRRNRDLLYESLMSFGYTCLHPDGAFYLFVKSPVPNAGEFCMKARDYELLLVPSDSFGCGGYVRIAYCVTTAMISRSLPAFGALAEYYGLKKQ